LLCLAVCHLVAQRVGVFWRPQTCSGRLRAVWTVGVTVGFPRTATARPRRRRALGLTRAAGPACIPCARPARMIPGKREAGKATGGQVDWRSGPVRQPASRLQRGIRCSARPGSAGRNRLVARARSGRLGRTVAR